MPKLFNDLCNSKIDTLKNFAVSNHEKPIRPLYSEAPMKIINMISNSTTASIKLRFWREYGLSDDGKLRTTNLRRLPTAELNIQQTASTVSLTYQDSENRNRWFTAKTISNNAWKNSYMVSLASSCTNFEKRYDSVLFFLYLQKYNKHILVWGSNAGYKGKHNNLT